MSDSITLMISTESGHMKEKNMYLRVIIPFTVHV